MPGCVYGEQSGDTAESKNLSMSRNSKRENREIPSVSPPDAGRERSVNVSDGTADMHTDGKSDESVVPATSTNNDGTEPLAELSEERDLHAQIRSHKGREPLASPGNVVAGWVMEWLPFVTAGRLRA